MLILNVFLPWFVWIFSLQLSTSVEIYPSQCLASSSYNFFLRLWQIGCQDAPEAAIHLLTFHTFLLWMLLVFLFFLSCHFFTCSTVNFFTNFTLLQPATFLSRNYVRQAFPPYSLSWLFAINDLTLVTHLLTNPLFFPCRWDLSSLASLKVIVDPVGDLLASPGLNMTKLDRADSVPSAGPWLAFIFPFLESFGIVILTWGKSGSQLRDFSKNLRIFGTNDRDIFRLRDTDLGKVP